MFELPTGGSSGRDTERASCFVPAPSKRLASTRSRRLQAAWSGASSVGRVGRYTAAACAATMRLACLNACCLWHGHCYCGPGHEARYYAPQVPLLSHLGCQRACRHTGRTGLQPQQHTCKGCKPLSLSGGRHADGQQCGGSLHWKAPAVSRNSERSGWTWPSRTPACSAIRHGGGT